MNLSPDQVTAVILAGGFGTRIKQMLANLPKPMAPVNGRPFVEWVVRYLSRQGIRRMVLSTGHLAETVERHFAEHPVKDVALRCIPESRPQGTAGGFLHAARTAGESPSAWLVLNGDSLALAPLDELFAIASGPDAVGAILGVPMSDAARYGTIVQNSDRLVTGFQEKKHGAGVINAGVYVFRPEAVDRFPKITPLSFENDVFPALIAKSARLKVCVTAAPFLDIGTPESLPLAEAFVRKHEEWFA